ncbi:MAG: hypothetical protein V4694_00645 [Pseudomonadota bacterium]
MKPSFHTLAKTVMKVPTSEATKDLARRTVSTMNQRAKETYHAPILPGTSITDIQKLAMKLAGKSPEENISIEPKSAHHLTTHHLKNHQTRAMWARATSKGGGSGPAWRGY